MTLFLEFGLKFSLGFGGEFLGKEGRACDRVGFGGREELVGLDVVSLGVRRRLRVFLSYVSCDLVLIRGRCGVVFFSGYVWVMLGGC